MDLRDNVGGIQDLIRGTGVVANDIFSDEEIYRKELDTVFTKSWLFVGHDQMLPNKGDFITSYMGEDSVIVVRDRANKVRVLLNKCLHRGNKVCLFDRGNTRTFTCSFHGWSYNTEGDLTGVPELGDAYLNQIDKNEKGLIEAKVETYGGLIFASWDYGIMPLEEYLGDLRWYLDNFFLMEEWGGLEIVPGQQRHMAPINWKLLAENFAGDHYHFKATHTSYLKVLPELPGDPNHVLANETPDTCFEVTINYKNGPPHSLGQVAAGPQYYEQDLRIAEFYGADAVDWVRQRHEYVQKRLKDLRTKPYSFNRAHIFPNFSLILVISALGGRGMMLWQPRSPVETEVREWCAVEKAAPDVVKKAAVKGLMGGQSAAGLIAADDMENFSRISENVQTPFARKQAFDYSMGLGYEGDKHPAMKGVDVDELPGLVSYNTTEINQREFLRHWGELMSSED